MLRSLFKTELIIPVKQHGALYEWQLLHWSENLNWSKPEWTGQFVTMRISLFFIELFCVLCFSSTDLLNDSHGSIGFFFPWGRSCFILNCFFFFIESTMSVCQVYKPNQSKHKIALLVTVYLGTHFLWSFPVHSCHMKNSTKPVYWSFIECLNVKAIVYEASHINYDRKWRAPNVSHLCGSHP